MIFTADPRREAMRHSSDVRREGELKLIDLDEEEDRDRTAVQLFMRKYAKLWRYLFTKYAHSGYSAKKENNFSELSDKMNRISMAELTKMLKDHDIGKHMVSKEELGTLIRLVNVKTTQKRELIGLSFEGFQEFFVQTAVHVFSKHPRDLSYLPPV